MHLIDYDRAAAIAYAERWALSRNPKYYSFNEIGGDCTNFVSQCLYAGCGVMNYAVPNGWFYIDLNNRSASWTSVQYFYEFLLSNRGPGPFARLSNYNEIHPADIIQLGDSNGRFYHSLFVLDVSPADIYVAAHSYDALWRPLSSYSYAKIRFLHILGARTQ